MQISFYIGDAFFQGFANAIETPGEQLFLVELDGQLSFYAKAGKDGNWTSDHSKGNRMIYDMVCAAGSEINFRMQLDNPDSAEPGAYESGCGMKDCPAVRGIFLMKQ